MSRLVFLYLSPSVNKVRLDTQQRADVLAEVSCKSVFYEIDVGIDGLVHEKYVEKRDYMESAIQTCFFACMPCAFRI